MNAAKENFLLATEGYGFHYEDSNHLIFESADEQRTFRVNIGYSGFSIEVKHSNELLGLNPFAETIWIELYKGKYKNEEDTKKAFEKLLKINHTYSE